MSRWTILWGSFLAIFGIQIVFFLIAAFFRTDKVIDLAYGTTFALVALFRWLQLPDPHLVQTGVMLAVAIRWVRLSGYLFMRIVYMGKDERFDGRREHWWSFAQFWLLQTITIWIVLLPVLLIMHPVSWWWAGPTYWIGVLFRGVGVCIESIADRQKFTAKRKDPDRWVESGLWKWARHPNYFGEMLVWRWVFAMCTELFFDRYRISIMSPLFIMWLLLYVSGVPLLEAQWEKKYGEQLDYQDYKRRTHLLVPVPSDRR